MKAGAIALWLVAVVVVALGGCGKSEPQLSGGKPAAHWVQVLQNPDPKLRKEAVVKLGNAGPNDAAVFPALVGALKDTDAQVRCEAILALLKCGPKAHDAIPALHGVHRNDRDSKVRAYAGNALEKLQGSS